MPLFIAKSVSKGLVAIKKAFSFPLQPWLNCRNYGRVEKFQGCESPWMGILVGTWKEGTIKVAVPSHWWRAKHFQGLFHSKRPNAPPQCTQFAQFCSGIKHQETSHFKLLIPISFSCCCWMIFKIAVCYLFFFPFVVVVVVQDYRPAGFTPL